MLLARFNEKLYDLSLLLNNISLVLNSHCYITGKLL